MSTREQNERKFQQWDELAAGGRRYWLDVASRSGWRVRYVKEVDAKEVTVRFYQEVYNENGELVEVHHKYPVDYAHIIHERFYCTRRHAAATRLAATCVDQPGGLAPRGLNILLQVCLGLSRLRAPVSLGVLAVSSRTVMNNVGLGHRKV